MQLNLRAALQTGIFSCFSLFCGSQGRNSEEDKMQSKLSSGHTAIFFEECKKRCVQLQTLGPKSSMHEGKGIPRESCPFCDTPIPGEKVFF